MNSGEARYLVNSESQSSWERGGRDPVTGRHSVILRLWKVLANASSSNGCSGARMGDCAYPDSVNLVDPPNTTIPKTLPAEANSQYPTALLDNSGQKPFLPSEAPFLLASCAAFSAAFCEIYIVSLKLLNGVFLVAAESAKAVLLLNRIFLERFNLPGVLTFERTEGLCRRHR